MHIFQSVTPIKSRYLYGHNISKNLQTGGLRWLSDEELNSSDIHDIPEYLRIRS